MKALLRQQWEANKAATGGHEWKPPEWAEIEQTASRCRHSNGMRSGGRSPGGTGCVVCEVVWFIL